MTLAIGVAMYAVVCFAAQLAICLLTRDPCYEVRNRILRATPFGFAFVLSTVLFVLGATIGQTPSNSLMGWLTFIGMGVFALSIGVIVAAWAVYGLVRFFAR